MIFIEITPKNKTEIMLHMDLAAIKPKICLVLNLLYVIWTEHIDKMIDTVRPVLQTAIKLVEHVSNIFLSSIV